MNAIRSLRNRAGVTQSALAEAGGTSQPTVAAYEAGRKSPTLDTVRRLARSVGLETCIAYHPPLTREERRSLALHRAIGQRLAEDPDAVLAQARRTLSRMLEGTAGDSQFIREWKVLLERPPRALEALLVDPDPWARELRHVTPFAGVLTPTERAKVYRDFRQRERGNEP